MTIASTTNKVSYNGAGSAGPFSIPFKFLKNADIVATHVSTAGLETVLTLTTDYTLSGAGDPSGGALTLNAVLSSGEKLIIKRSPGIVQETDYVENAAFPAESHETALDLLTMIAQDNAEKISRAVLVPISSSTSPEDLLAELSSDVAAAAASAAAAVVAETAAETAQGLAEDARDEAIAAANGVKVSADDTTPGPLETKLTLASNSGLVFATTSPGGDERRTLAADAGTGAGQLVQLNAQGKLPSVDGSLLTKILGNGQTWSNQTANRAKETFYTNSTGAPIVVVVRASLVAGGSMHLIGGGGVAATASSPGGAGAHTLSLIIPNGVTYRLYDALLVNAVYDWYELR